MAERSKPGRKRSRVSWWWGVIIPAAAIFAAIWFLLIREPEHEALMSIPEQVSKSYPEAAVEVQELPVAEEQIESGEPGRPESSVDDLPSPESPWVALIIDDFGPPSTANLLKGFQDLPFELTYSIIPGYTKSIWVGKTVHEAGGEVFIHLPMEPTRKVSMKERDMVLVGMDSLELKAILDRVTGDLPFAVGLNNHMGSKATLDDPLMKMLADELKKRGLIFIDSRTVPRSRGYPNMVAAGVPALGRDVFIDNYCESDDIIGQVSELIRIARRRGWAVGIGHPYRETLIALTEAASMIEDTGVRFVTVTALVNAVRKIRRERIAAVVEQGSE